MRSSRTTSLLAVVVAAGLAVPFVVAAAPPPPPASSAAPAVSGSAAPAASGQVTPEAKEEAKEHFLKGVSLMQEEQWDAALVEFQTSFKLFPTRNARKNAAVCLRQLGRFDEALDEYEALMREYGTQLPPADLESVTKAIEDLKKVTGYITVNSNVPGAQVIIDSKARGTTPMGPVRVRQGTHSIRVVKEGYTPFETTLAVLGKQTVPVDAKLEVLARSGRIIITEESGTDATVFIDGVEKGKVGKQPYEEKLGPGQHWVHLRGPGNTGTMPVPAKVEVDQLLPIRLRLVELPGEARIEVEPVGSTIMLDGVYVGSGSWDGRVSAGSHKIDATSEGYFHGSKSFEATTEKKATVKVTLDRDENSPFWTKGRTRPISVGLFGGGLFGLFGFGSDYERNCNAPTPSAPTTADCYLRSKPFGGIGGARAGYEVAPGLSIELELGYAYVTSKLSRKTKLLGEQSVPVDVDITDEFSLSGFVVGVGASYAFIRRPIVIAGAITGGAIISARIRNTRGGTTQCTDPARAGAADCSGAVTEAQPSPRAMNPTTGSDKKTIPWFTPEIRVSYPITESFSVGLGIGVFIGIGEGRPRITQTPTTSANDLDDRGVPNQKPSVPGPGGTIGFIPQTNANPESAIGTFILPRATLFVKLAF